MARNQTHQHQWGRALYSSMILKLLTYPNYQSRPIHQARKGHSNNNIIIVIIPLQYTRPRKGVLVPVSGIRDWQNMWQKKKQCTVYHKFARIPGYHTPSPGTNTILPDKLAQINQAIY